jgi:uncharacterized protein YceK
MSVLIVIIHLLSGCGRLVEGINNEGNSPKHATPIAQAQF